MATQPSLLFTHRSFWPTQTPPFLPSFLRCRCRASWMQRARCQKTCHQVPFRKVGGTRRPLSLILFSILSFSPQPLPSFQPPPGFLYPARLQHLEQRGFAFNTSGSGRFSRIGRDIHDPLIVCPRGFGERGFYPRGWIRLAAKPGRILSLALVKPPFFTRADKRPYLLLRPWIKGTLRN